MNTSMIRRFVAGAVMIVAAALPAAAKAAPTIPPPADSYYTRCSGWSRSIQGLRYRDCLVPDTEGWVRTGLQVINATQTERWVTFFQDTLVNGVALDSAYCQVKVQPGDSAVATCWTAYVPGPSSGSATGTGAVIDNSSGHGGMATSPRFPR